MEYSQIKRFDRLLRTLKETKHSTSHTGWLHLDPYWKIQQITEGKVFTVAEQNLVLTIFEALSCFKWTKISSLSNYSVVLKPKYYLSSFITAVDQSFEGKLLCRTRISPIKMNSLLIVVEILAFDKKDQGALISLLNLYPVFQEEESSVPIWKHILSQEKILTAKNSFYISSADLGYIITCDNSTAMVVPGNTKFVNLFLGLKLSSGHPQNENSLDLKKSLWSWWKKLKEWTSIANLHLENKNYVSAIEAYTLALDYNPRNIAVLTQRCSLYLRLKIYEKSLRDAEAILNENPFHKEAICHKANSLIALSNYGVAKEFLRRHMTECTCITDPIQKTKLSELLLKAKKYSKQEKYGIYDLTEMLSCPLKFFHECADYTGSVVECSVKGKGRGMVATKDIKCGNLIMGEKAFEIAFPNDLAYQEYMWILNSEADGYISPVHAKLTASIAHRLLRDPEICKTFYRLHDGTERSVSGDAVENKFVDMKKIDSIVSYNGFSGVSKSDIDNKSNSRSLGIWLSSSYFNHSCSDANGIWIVCGNFLFVRASKNIFKGEEITLSYISCTTPYPDRLYILSKYGFVCDCRLCIFDAEEREEIHLRRRDILAEIDNLEKEIDPQLSQIATLIQELQDQRVEYPNLNVYIAEPMINLGQRYIKYKHYDLAVKILWSLYCCGFHTIIYGVSLRCCMDCLQCYLNCNNLDKAKICAGALKIHLIQEYGTYSMKVLNYISPTLSKAIVESGILL